jgi:uncharacterized BrkB/YihY/UPF0761 family membrane protein
MYDLWLFLHVLGAIAAFGYGFASPIIGSMASREPQHANWSLRASQRVTDLLVLPVAVSLFVTGTLLVVETGGFKRFQEAWLAIAFVIYVLAILAILFVQRPATSRVIALTSDTVGAQAAGAAEAEVERLLRRTRMTGMALGVAVVVIVALMVYRPTL